MRGDETAAVVEGFTAWLSARGWTLRPGVEFADIAAERDGHWLYVEVNGATMAPELDVNAAIGELLSRMPGDTDTTASYALVVRDEPRTVAAAARVPQRVLDLVNITVYAVDEAGVVRHLPGRR